VPVADIYLIFLNNNNNNNNNNVELLNSIAYMFKSNCGISSRLIMCKSKLIEGLFVETVARVGIF
jgi:hypothetical protein